MFLKNKFEIKPWSKQEVENECKNKPIFKKLINGITYNPEPTQSNLLNYYTEIIKDPTGKELVIFIAAMHAVPGFYKAFLPVLKMINKKIEDPSYQPQII